MGLTSEPCKIGLRYEKGKQALDLRPRSGQEGQDQKDQMLVQIDERIQKVSDFGIQLEAPGAGVQQSSGAACREATEGESALGPEVS
jgi:hypothetical protein